MADNVTLNTNTTTGATLRTIDRSGIETPVSVIDVGGSGAEAIVGNANVYMPVEGAAANDTSASGNPVLVGAVYLNSHSAITDGNAASLRVDNYANLKVVIRDAAGNDRGVNVDTDGSIYVTTPGVHQEDFDTRVAPEHVDTTSCYGIAVPSASGAVAIKGTTVGSDVGLNVNILNASNYTEDDPAATNPVGGASILVREDSTSGALAGSLVDTNGDNVAQRGTNYGSSYVTNVSSDGKVGVLEGWDYDATNPAAQKIKVSSTGQVHVTGISGGGTEYLNASTGNTFTGGVLIAEDDAATGTARVLKCSASGSLNVDVGTPTVGLGTSLIHVAGRTAINNTQTATAMLVDAAGHLQVDVQSMPAVSLGTNNPVSLQTSGTNLTSTTVGTDQCLDVFVQGGVSGTEYTEDAPLNATNPSGGTAILVRADGTSGELPNNVVTDDGDYIANRGTKYGSSYVTTVSSDGKVGVLQGWDYASSNAAAHKIKVDSSGSVHVSVNGTIPVTGTVQADSQGKFYDRAYGSSAAGSSASVAQVDVNSYGQITLGTSYEVGRTGTLDSLGITGTKPHVSLSGAIIDSTLEDLTDSAGANHADGDAVQLRVNDNGRLYVEAGNVGVSSLPSLPAGGNNIGNVDVASLPSLVAGTNVIGKVRQHTHETDGNAFHSNVNVTATISASQQLGGGGTGQGCLISFVAFNTTSSPIYLKFWNQNYQNVTIGTTVPDMTFLVPSNAGSNGAGFVFSVPGGIHFNVGMTYAATTGIGTSDTTAPPTNGCILNAVFSQKSS